MNYLNNFYQKNINLVNISIFTEIFRKNIICIIEYSYATCVLIFEKYYKICILKQKIQLRSIDNIIIIFLKE